MLAVAAACRVASVDYAGKQCPCPSGYSCDPAAMTCVRGALADAAVDAGVSCPADGFFCDGFETGDTSRWSTTDVSAGATLAVESATVHTGAFALDGNVPAMPTNGALSAVIEQFPTLSTGTLAARMWLYLPQPLVNFDSVLTLGSSPHTITIDADNGGHWTATEHTPSANPPDHVSTTLAVTAAWTCLELDYQFATGVGAAVITLYIQDGVVLTVAAADPAAMYGQARVGVSRADMAGDEVIADDVVLATQHIGCN